MSSSLVLMGVEMSPSFAESVDIQCDVNVEDGVNVMPSSSSSPLEPFIGTVFEEVEDTQAYYKAYAMRKGFAIRTNHTRLLRDDKTLCAVDYVCTREGFRQKDGEKWIVNKFVVEHNHILLTPRNTSFLRRHMGVTKIQKKLIMTLNESGVQKKKIMSVLSKDSGENYMRSKRRKIFENGDAQRLYSYFLDRQLKKLGFVFSMQVDNDWCMRSCFWADARSRTVYQYFGDVVTFDVTYLKDIYKMPFVPFSGVNHHHQTIILGCALLVNETAESYICLLKTWQEAMLGRAPATIFTDNDKATAKAIVEVLPNKTHRLCLWHILQKFPEHLAHVYNKFLDFQKDFRHCIHETITTDEFEIGSMNKFFKDYVRSSTMVNDFVHQYEKAIDARYFKEREKDVRTKSTRAIMKTPFKIEEEAYEVYTRKSFMIFQDKLFNCLRYQARKLNVIGEAKTYGVTAHGKETSFYHVTLEGDEIHTTCTCHMWEFMGILCRHILCVFDENAKLNGLPQHYVLDRWTINSKNQIILDIPCFDDQLRQ
ncbi:hypothetical protein I3842_16G092600 [Carya illinoinensis]|uniref:Protein FAR1-RELATED SEQUENCE n=1 Tax=Carya illinoinensis TaxID=32201 RepID=A0A922A642_CARIL|nr:hypothetical protein I3842_16G092600 [Carya illinoinensis]